MTNAQMTGDGLVPDQLGPATQPAPALRAVAAPDPETDDVVIDITDASLVETDRRLTRAMKDIGDRAIALVLLLVTLPLFVLIAVAIRLTSSGPVFYSQSRVGRGGVPFRFFKFRTMVEGADQMVDELADHNDCDGVLFKMHRDPRITTIGRWLRRLSLDELPQLLNVLRGDMSIVGPRPALPSEVANYPGTAHLRHCVKPGITGLWQVSGRADLSWNQAVDLDLHYVENWSLAMDTKILVKTIPAVVTGRGAY